MLARPNCLNFVGNEIIEKIQKDFVEKFYLLIRVLQVVKMFVSRKHFNTLPNSYKVYLIVVPNLVGARRYCYV